MSETIIIVGVPTVRDAFLEVDGFLEELKRNDIPIVRVMKNPYKVCTKNCTILFIPRANPDSIRGRKCHACFGFSEEEQCYLNFSHRPTKFKGMFTNYVIEIEKVMKKMITINLDEHSGEDVAEIMKLRAMGVPDEIIQFGYNNTVAKRREASENDAGRTAEGSKETGV